jgi:threonine synthase
MTPSGTPAMSKMVCAGCGAEGDDVYPFRCVRAVKTDDIDHVMTRVRGSVSPAFPRIHTTGRSYTDQSLQYMMPVTGPNPFVVYRRLFYSYDVGRSHGMTDAEYVRLVEELDDAVAAVDGHGFVVSPFARHTGLGDRVGLGREGGLWIKNETGNVSGSHKARHLMGIMIYLQVLERTGLVGPPLPGLAIASCGNAALAAAVIARAAKRPLRVFIPPDAPASVVDRLIALHAERTVCRRDPDVVGDPCYAAFLDTVASASLPFCCQGNENGLTIEGGETLGYEMISSGVALDRVVIQVGGGALASSVIQAFTEARALGVLARLPRFHAVQTRGAYPLKRAYDRLADRIRATGDTGRELRYAATHRSEFMWPWEMEPRSIAHGILDDETYDWFAVVKGMLVTGGHPVVVGEAQLEEAYALARTMTGVDVDHTGAAGLAGLLELHRAGAIEPGEKVAVVFSGVERGSSA